MAELKCKKCGTPINKGDKFCANCGTAIVELATPAVDQKNVKELLAKTEGKTDEEKFKEFEKEELDAAMVRGETEHFGDIVPAVESVSPPVDEERINLAGNGRRRSTSSELDTSPTKFMAFSGRLARWEYFILTLKIWIGSVVAVGIMEVIDSDGIMVMFIGLLCFAATVYLTIANLGAMVRRCHDLNRTGWWVLLIFIPIIAFLFQIYILLARGTDGSNDYGLRRV